MCSCDWRAGKMSEPEYDEQTCLTAGELRSMGLVVPEEIPDVAWVPKDSVKIGEGRNTTWAGSGPRVIKVSMSIRITEPFRWVEATLVPDGVVP